MTQTIYFDPETPERLQPFHTALAFSHTSIQFQEAGEKKVVFMLGAGVSTAWLPDFRGQQGLYRAKPISASGSSPPPSSSAPSPSIGSSPLKSQGMRALFHSSVYRTSSTRTHHFELMAELHKRIELAEDAARRSVDVTATHGLMRLVKGMGKLGRVYSQNIDALEGTVGLSFVPLDSGDEDDDGDVVQLHGSLKFVRCAVCRWVGEWKAWHTEAFERSDSMLCPDCAGRAAEREKQNKRAINTSGSFVRPAILLYGEPMSSVASSALDRILQDDLDTGPQLLVVMGTSLRIPGFRNLVKSVASKVHELDGLVIFVNLEPVAGDWDDVFDYFFQTTCDHFTRRLLYDWKNSCPSSFA